MPNYIRDKAVSMPHDSQRQAGTELREIEITPEMIEAGVKALWEAGRTDYQADGPDQLLVREILRAAFVQAGYAIREVKRHLG